MLKRNKIIISGNVRGVFFRRFVFENAVSLGLKGYVKNRDDGKVEAVFEGEEVNVKKMVERCRIGNPLSKVKNIIINEEIPKRESEFRIIS